MKVLVITETRPGSVFNEPRGVIPTSLSDEAIISAIARMFKGRPDERYEGKAARHFLTPQGTLNLTEVPFN